jgi:hypothetical protein
VSIKTHLASALTAIRDRAVTTWRNPSERTRLGTELVAWLGLVVATLWELWPMLRDTSTYGFHDWDVATAYRYITPVSLLRYHEFPWWNPWLCGGFPAFGYVEGATNLVSPFLPFYLLTDVRVAIRADVLGTTLVGVMGAYVLAGRFTRSVALRTLVAVLAFLNGRWTLQAATGHGWHLVFCWMPWVLWSFDRALEPARWYRALHAAAFMALIIYGGGIYPVPYTALLLGGYALCMVLFTGSWRPILALAVTGLATFGFGAPKLLAIMDIMRDAPRLIESKEVIGIAELWVMLTDRTQAYGSRPVPIPAYNWHEWGIYVGVAGVVCLAIGLFFARGARENALRMLGLGCLLLGLGAFRPDAPWALLHRVPPFTSLHVPSRFHFPMVLLLALCFASWADRWVEGWVRRKPIFDLLLLVPVAWMTADILGVAQRPMAQAFWMEAPPHIEPRPFFEHTQRPSVTYVRPDWAPPVLLPMLANAGVIECYGVPEPLPRGARGIDSPEYRGRAWIARGTGKARVEEWSPSRAVVRLEGVPAGSLVVYNMNWDLSWTANGRPALEYEHAVAAYVEGDSGRIEFRYRPRSLGMSMTLFLLTLGIVVGGPLGWRRWRRGKASHPKEVREATIREHSRAWNELGE